MAWYRTGDKTLSKQMMTSSIGWDNDLALNRRQFIILTNIDLVYWHIYVSLNPSKLEYGVNSSDQRSWSTLHTYVRTYIFVVKFWLYAGTRKWFLMKGDHARCVPLMKLGFELGCLRNPLSRLNVHSQSHWVIKDQAIELELDNPPLDKRVYIHIFCLLKYVAGIAVGYVMAEWLARWPPLWVTEGVSEFQRSWIRNHAPAH